MDMIHSPYSASKMLVHKQCPKKFKFQYIDKINRFKESLALLKGKYIHKVLENKFGLVEFDLSDIFPKEEMIKADKIISKFRKSDLGEKYSLIMDIDEYNSRFEEEFAINQALESCDYWDKTAWIRGSIDFLYFEKSNKLAYIIDWKSGKAKTSKYDKDFGKEQGRLYAIYVFLKYKEVNTIKTRFVFVEHSVEIERTYEREDLFKLLNELLKETIEIEIDKQMLPKVSVLCDWCNYKDLCIKD